MFVNDSFIRPFFGDVLVVIWLFYTLATLVSINRLYLIIAAVAIAYLVELSQYFQLTQLLGVEAQSLLYVVLGATFDWLDLIAYSIGGLFCWGVERQ
ncbi:DUF2809 domain-containing protein [Vibrio sonorensis]|uniref:ribosomal maturation YjgA family protein n=1 Tax=Vibrio sonorensis TaxID=1004316 RepID=UPI001FDF04E7|nr:DUF2809 domain-containing protein [Vibrio sonorensis]